MKTMWFIWVLVCFSLTLTDAEARRRNNPANDTGGIENSEEAEYSKEVPVCFDKDRRAISGNNNSEVLKWKVQTPNQYLDRALIVGRFVKVLLDRKSHLQIEVDISPNGSDDKADHIEIIYNKEFGAIPAIPAGAKVAACGDYITASAQSGPYPPSPMGAIVHWVHASNKPERHAHGYVLVNGTLYGHSGDANKNKR